MLTNEDKELLESYESTVDNVVNEILLMLENTDPVYDSYFEFRNVLQQAIKSAFPKGTKFDNF